MSINYRLGALGFLAHDSLRDRDGTRGSTGNYGLLDAIFVRLEPLLVSPRGPNP